MKTQTQDATFIKHEKYASAMKYLIYNYDQSHESRDKQPRTPPGQRARGKSLSLGVVPRKRETDCDMSAFPSNVELTDDERTRVQEVIKKELRQTTAAYDFLQRVAGVGFKTVPSMNVTEMRRCLKHGRQRLQCNRPHAPLALCERILGNMTLGEFGHWLQLMYHLRRFVKGLVKSCNLTPNMQAEIVNVAQRQIILEFAEPPESALWCMEYSHAHYTVDTSAPDEFCTIVKAEAFSDPCSDDSAGESPRVATSRQRAACNQTSLSQPDHIEVRASEGSSSLAEHNAYRVVASDKPVARVTRKRSGRNTSRETNSTTEKAVSTADHVMLDGRVKVATLQINSRSRTSRGTEVRGTGSVADIAKESQVHKKRRLR